MASPLTTTILNSTGATVNVPVPGTDASNNVLYAVAPNVSTTAATLTQAFVNVPTAGTAVPLAGSPTLVQRVTVIGQKAEQTANTGIVRIGFASNSQPIAFPVATIDQAGIITFEAITGKKIDLSQLYVNAATNGDGVLVLGFN